MIFRETVHKVAFVPRGRLLNHDAELEVQLRIAARKALLNKWHNAEKVAVPPAEWGHYYASVWESWGKWKPRYELCASTPQVM